MFMDDFFTFDKNVINFLTLKSSKSTGNFEIGFNYLREWSKFEFQQKYYLVNVPFYNAIWTIKIEFSQKTFSPSRFEVSCIQFFFIFTKKK